MKVILFVTVFVFAIPTFAGWGDIFNSIGDATDCVEGGNVFSCTGDAINNGKKSKKDKKAETLTEGAASGYSGSQDNCIDSIMSQAEINARTNCQFQHGKHCKVLKDLTQLTTPPVKIKKWQRKNGRKYYCEAIAYAEAK